MNLRLAPGIGDKNDCDVLDDGRRIGRVFLSSYAPAGRPWFWGIFPPPVGNEGYAATREEAVAVFKAQWLRNSTQVQAGRTGACGQVRSG
jgi:hypothetical protein